MAITAENLRRQVECNRAYRQSQLSTFYDSYEPVRIVDEYTSLDRLGEISRAVGVSPKVGLRNQDGSTQTLVVEWEGCRFWANAGRCD